MIKNYTIIGLLGSLLSILVFFVAVFFKDKFDNVFGLVYPLSLFLAYFFIGLAAGGNIKSGLKQASVFVLMLLFAILFGSLSWYLKSK